MRLSATVATALVLAPLSMASQINNLYPRELKRVVHARAPEAEKSRMSVGEMDSMKEEKSKMESKMGKMRQSESNMGESKKGESSKGGEKNKQAETGRGGGGGAQQGAQGSVAPVIIIWTNAGGGAERQSVNEKVTVTERVAAGQTGVNAVEGAQATHTIKVGGPGGLVYSPPVSKLEVGAMVVWEFYSKNHTVTQSTFDKPCEKMEGGFDTGFMPNPNDMEPPPQVAMQVMTSEPLWFKCSQGKHCQQAMVASINAKDGEKSHSAFQEKAVKSGGEAAGGAAGTNSTTSAGKEGGSKTGSSTGQEGGAGGSTTGKESAKEPSATSTRPEASTRTEASTGGGSSSSSRPEAGLGSGGRTEAGTGGGGATGQVGAAEGDGTVARGQGTMVDGVCNCVAPCSNGGASSAEKKPKRSVERRQAGGSACTCIALCGGVMTSSSTGASGGMEGRLPTAMMAAVMAGTGSRGNTGSASGASGTSSASSARSTSGLSSSMENMAGMAGTGMAGRR